MQRRDFIRSGFFATAATFLAHEAPGRAGASELNRRAAPAVSLHERICLFTDHLDDFGYSYADVASMLVPLKIAGPDLTVRSGGLVAPERVADELPKAAAAFRDKGLSIPMISTGLTSAGDPAARPTFAAMKQLGIGYYKLGYYPYRELSKWEAELETCREELTGLINLSRAAGLRAGFHNHSGPTVGGALWDSWELLRQMDPAAIGFYFDPSHATIEGGKHGWMLNLQRAAPRITMVAIKDFLWEKTPDGWRTRWCPLGEGMVNWPEFFKQLAQVPFPGPLSLHIEYDPGGSTRPERIDNSLAAAQRDLAFLRKHLPQPPSAK